MPDTENTTEVKLTVEDPDGDWSLLIVGKVTTRAGAVVPEGGRIILQPGGKHVLSLPPEWYSFEFDVHRHSGPFKVVVEARTTGSAWGPLTTSPTSWQVPPWTGHAAIFEVT